MEFSFSPPFPSGINTVTGYFFMVVVMAATIVVDKPGRNVRAYGPDGRLLAFYPATIGSAEKPAPSGVFRAIAFQI